MRRRLALALVLIAAALALVGCGRNILSPDIRPHYSASGSAHTPAIDNKEGATVNTVAELYDTVVYDGKRPIFSDTGSDAAKVYDKAHSLLSLYIRDEWASGGQVEIVHTVHDMLADMVEYDFDLYEKYKKGEDVDDDPSFFIDGVFLANRGVCDGIALAFNFLCAMEDIESVRVTGTFAKAPHAWNKVKVAGEWYNVDVTSDAVYYSADGKMHKQVGHGYFMLSDDTYRNFLPDVHDFSHSTLVAKTDYDYYGGVMHTVGGEQFGAVIKNQAALESLFYAIDRAGGQVGKIELKLDYQSKMHVNSADMYTEEIYAAYTQITYPAFSMQSQLKPYFRFPNGVYLFLIYK